MKQAMKHFPLTALFMVEHKTEIANQHAAHYNLILALCEISGSSGASCAMVLVTMLKTMLARLPDR